MKIYVAEYRYGMNLVEMDVTESPSTYKVVSENPLIGMKFFRKIINKKEHEVFLSLKDATKYLLDAVNRKIQDEEKTIKKLYDEQLYLQKALGVSK